MSRVKLTYTILTKPTATECSIKNKSINRIPVTHRYLAKESMMEQEQAAVKYPPKGKKYIIKVLKQLTHMTAKKVPMRSQLRWLQPIIRTKNFYKVHHLIKYTPLL